MCTNYTLSKLKKEVEARFKVESAVDILPERTSNFPAEMVPVVTQNNLRTLELMKWGLIPSWAKDASIGKKMLNARVETIADKPAFKSALLKRRCLIPADGFYEWHTEGKQKIRYFIHLKSSGLFAFAGLWEQWNDPEGGPLHSCTMITCAPNPLMAAIHNRMPVILRAEDEDRWLSSELTRAEDVLPLLQPYNEFEMESYIDEKPKRELSPNQASFNFT